MISYIKGELREISEKKIVIENQNMGYNIIVPTSLIPALPAVGNEVRVYTYLYVREDAINLYGFLSKDDLGIFKMLIQVSGIGPKGALGILSTITPDELRMSVLANDAKTISRAPGIGAKTAQRLIIELRDKVNPEDILGDTGEEGFAANTDDIRSEAVQALATLGYSITESHKAVNSAYSTNITDVEALLREALKKLI
ncbi:Holliday junction branch migration protein RuvA [Parasporobacterium paucivorans]|uniref:Holliday junction branch migration complex subunit RuvA n=1 Tax=Parasporobacterium paucivorans DSM 15970 TaxID=1122934 RepID=A0A1M6ABZ2_9FIRM|nr:Holliday junction branch migration protein RuvA [Parasporobacterium paucivorans]SHI34012.1 Holliday junction DNA helicase subunit RuvA [Parasporobacterium paucivorans DSM 15970]